MRLKVMLSALAALCANGLWAATTEAVVEFALDNVLATRLLHGGEKLTVVRDAAWAEGGVTFSMTGRDDEVLTEGSATEVTIPSDISHVKVFSLGLTAGDEVYSYRFLAIDGAPNVLADHAAEFPLDSRTGEVRLARPVESIVYSDRWSTGASAPVLLLNDESVELTGKSGVYSWGTQRPHVEKGLAPGLYVFTHNDGVELLTASFKVAAFGTAVILK